MTTDAERLQRIVHNMLDRGHLSFEDLHELSEIDPLLSENLIKSTGYSGQSLFNAVANQRIEVRPLLEQWVKGIGSDERVLLLPIINGGVTSLPNNYRE